MRFRPRSLSEPLGHPLLDLFLGERPVCLDILEPTLNLLAPVDVVLDILERGIVRQLVKQFSDFVLVGAHNVLLAEQSRSLMGNHTPVVIRTSTSMTAAWSSPRLHPGSAWRDGPALTFEHAARCNTI